MEYRPLFCYSQVLRLLDYMKKTYIVLVVIFVFVLGFIFYYPAKIQPTLFDSSNKIFVNIISNRYAQLSEYSDDLNSALKATENARKKEKAILAMLKITLVNDSLQYLQAGLDTDNEADMSLMIARLDGMRSHTIEFLQKLGDKHILSSDEEKVLQKDIVDAKFIFQTLNYQWISQGNHEFITVAILDRLTHHSEISNMTGDSYRLKHRNTFMGKKQGKLFTEIHPKVLVAYNNYLKLFLSFVILYVLSP